MTENFEGIQIKINDKLTKELVIRVRAAEAMMDKGSRDYAIFIGRLFRRIEKLYPEYSENEKTLDHTKNILNILEKKRHET